MTIQLLHTTLIAACCCALWVAIATDIATRTVPNLVCLAIAVMAFALRVADGTWTMAIVAMAAVFLPCYMFWRRGWMGGGDVKLLAATALLVVPANVPGLIFSVTLAGGALGLLYLGLSFVIRRPAGRRPSSVIFRVLRLERLRIIRRCPLPYACAIAAGTFNVLLNG